ncbi:glycoside hydrolase family 16 protein [Auricularia subglabra TFB-10046 SS5]|nr:glycoside hydrolase family 16 protein [Auricularia subglabra TFB-10046 SS5]
MLTLKSFVIIVAAIGATAAKKHKRACTTTTPTPEPTSPPSQDPPPPPSGGGQAAGEYGSSEEWVGDNWFKGWDFWAYPDPTHGRVNYVDHDTALSQNLTSTTSDSFVMRADSWSVLDPNGPGRNSVRIQSKRSFTTHAAVIDVRHMPQGSGTWPAYWMCGDNWPFGGEFDIIEGVNDGEMNLSSLHTGPDCTQPGQGRDMKGSATELNCDAAANGNQGCGVVSDSPKSFGPNFNQAGGGWFATERTENTLKVWFWGRGDSSVPDEVRSSSGFVSPSTWGKPYAVFVSDSCNISQKFGPNAFIINLTLCGDWAGNTFNGGIGACNDFVNNNPSAFSDAFWDIARMSVYE